MKPRNAYQKALRNMRAIPYRDIYANCVVCDDEGWRGEIGMTKQLAVKEFQAEGWTYDKNGNWICPNCGGKS